MTSGGFRRRNSERALGPRGIHVRLFAGSQRRAAATAAINIERATEAGPEPRDRGLRRWRGRGGVRGRRKFWSGPGEVCFLPSQEKDLNPKQLRDCLATQADSLFVKDL